MTLTIPNRAVTFDFPAEVEVVSSIPNEKPIEPNTEWTIWYNCLLTQTYSWNLDGIHAC